MSICMSCERGILDIDSNLCPECSYSFRYDLMNKINNLEQDKEDSHKQNLVMDKNEYRSKQVDKLRQEMGMSRKEVPAWFKALQEKAAKQEEE